MKLSVCMIVKNEEVMLEQCLSSVIGADELIICDTGSIDKTVEIAKKYTDKVYTDFEWCDSFAKARNHANSKATGDWILTIDADEHLEPGGLALIREAIKDFDGDAINLNVVATDKSTVFKNIRLYRNAPHVKWHGAAHNYVSVPATKECEATIVFGYSPAHKLDPDRTMRILEKATEDNPSLSREWYYLGREYWYRGQYQKAIDTLDIYVKGSKNIPERSDAYLMQARALWAMRRGEEARQTCMLSILNNANFKEAVLFMAELHWEHNANAWKKFAECCTNGGVLFKRVE